LASNSEPHQNATRSRVGSVVSVTTATRWRRGPVPSAGSHPAPAGGLLIAIPVSDPRLA